MSATLREGFRNLWVTIGVLIAGALVLRALNLTIPAGILVILAILVFVFGVVPTWGRSVSGGETADEAAARAEAGDRAREKLAALEAQVSQAPDSKEKLRALHLLLSQYLPAYEKSSNVIPNGPRPVDIEDGDFCLLAKKRSLLEEIVATDPKPAKWMAKEVRKINESVRKWREAVEEVRAGTREAPEHFNAEDYLRRLDEAFPEARS